MNINRINPSTQFLGKENLIKEFNGKLTNGATAHVKIHLNQSGDPYSMQCIALNGKGQKIEGITYARKPKLKLTEIADFLTRISDNAKDWDVLKSFTTAMRS